MAADKAQKPEDKKTDKKQFEKKEEKKEKKAFKHEEIREEVLIRIGGYDIPGSKQLYPGLTRVKGVGWGISNAICTILKLPRTKKISELSKDEIKKIEDFLKEPKLQDFMLNRRKDFESGESKHYFGTNLDMRKDFDIRRLKKIRSYKGIRHTAGLPVRGQRTRSHFRKKGQAVRVKKK
jgi:small subunit ribosomal protein S13